MRASRPLFLLALGPLAALALAACDDGDGAPCLLDSDCANLTQVCIESRCQAPGGSRDGAVERDAGEPERDAGGGTDAGGGGTDAGTIDAAVADAALPDAMVDAAAPTDGAPVDAAPACPDPTGAWTVATVTPSACGVAAAGNQLTVSAGGACAFNAATADGSPGPAADGTFSLGAAGEVSGTIGIGGGAAVTCTGSMGTTLQFICGACTIDFTR